MSANSQDLNNSLLTQGGHPISAAMIVEWLQADQVAMSLLQGYLAAGKLGLITPESQKNAPFSRLGLKIKDDYG
jgi:hypothetical protein